jgi:hypothetical protein
MMARSATAVMLDRIERCGFHFMKDEAGWALFDLDDRAEIKGTRTRQLGNTVWAAAETLGLTEETA